MRLHQSPKQTDIQPTSEPEPLAQSGSYDWRARACVTLKEAAFILSTPPSQLRKLCRQGVLNPITALGRKWRIATEDIDRLLHHRLRNERRGA